MEANITVTIRKADLQKDLAALCELGHPCFEYPWSRNDFLHYIPLKSCCVRVAEKNGLIVGFCAVEKRKKYCLLLGLAVHPSYRRQGIGTKLFKDAIAQSMCQSQLKNCMELYVWEKNLPAQLFFRKLWCILTETHVGYYKQPNSPDVSGKDAYVMQYYWDYLDITAPPAKVMSCAKPRQ